MDNEPYQTFATESYADIQNRARKIKENWTAKKDPILQRTDNYVFHLLNPYHQNIQKIYKPTREKINYLNQIQEKDEKINRLNKSFINKSRTIYTESDWTPKKTGIRTYYKEFDIKKDELRRDHSGIRIFKQANASVIGKVLASSKDCPVYKERFHFKKAITGGIPTKDYQIMNSKKTMLPHQIFPPKSERDKTPTPISSSYTKLFSHYNNNGKTKTINLKINLSNINTFDKKYRHKKDHVKNIIYTTPRYRDIIYTDKPNRVKYQALLTQIEKNKRDNKTFFDEDD